MGFFPHDKIREGQKQFIADCEKAVKSKGNLIAHAPTGIGKTAAVLSEAVAYALQNQKTIFFLTPKHTQHTIVVDTLARIKERHKLSLSVVDIIGKQWMCPHRVRDLNSREFNEYCRAQKRDELCEHYNNTCKNKATKKANQAVHKILEKPIHNEQAQKICDKYGLCPYEVLLKAGRKADVVVCDYFHLFIPPVRNAFLKKLDREVEDGILVVDEAHNLPGRVRKILSNSLTTYSLDKAAKEARHLSHLQLAEDLEGTVKVLKKLGKRLKPGQETYLEKNQLIQELEAAHNVSFKEFQADVESLGEEVLRVPKKYKSYARSAARFLGSWLVEDLGYARILRKDKRKIALSIKCLDPAVSCKEVFDQAHCCVLMSGTMTPLDMYCDTLGLASKRTSQRAYSNPFPRKNKLTLLVPGLTTKYSHRSPQMYMKYADTISKILDSTPGNAAVFYPSYQLLSQIGPKVYTSKTVVAERQDMKKHERSRLFDRLVGLSEDGGGVLMGVQAGSFSEGLDYAGNLLDAVVIVGLPLERPNLETQALIEYYDFKFERGWDYGYIYPAMNRALQAAGRCIRGEDDRGAIVLLDDRFSWANYRKCFPSDFMFTVSELPQLCLKSFFSL